MPKSIIVPDNGITYMNSTLLWLELLIELNMNVRRKIC